MRAHFLTAAAALACLAGALAPAASAQNGAIMPAPRRVAALKVAGQILAPKETSWRTVVADLPDPFFRTNLAPAAGDAAPAEDAGPARVERSDLEVLKAVAPGITPTGTMLIGAEPYLLVGGKRLRVGDQISVTFDGLVYQVAVASIERNSYTLRLNEHELRREFK